MKRLLRLSLPLALSLAALAAGAEEAPTLGVYQQRLADGSIVISDRPVEGAKIVRTWQMARENAATARVRSEQVRLEAQAVSERVQRQIERQQATADGLEVERLRASLADARRDAEQARASAAESRVLFIPRGLSRSVLPRSLVPRSTRPGERTPPMRRRHDAGTDDF
jgi:hypothetical protein